MTSVAVSFRNQVLQNFQKTLADFGEKDARKILNMALNKIGRHAFVVVKRDLRNITGISYDDIETYVHEIKSKPDTLTFKIRSASTYTNLRSFKPYQGPRAFTAAPWNQRHQFPATFQIGFPATAGGLVFHRTGPKRMDIRPSFGPSLSVEMERGKVPGDFQENINPVLAEIARLIRLRLSGQGPFSFSET